MDADGDARTDDELVNDFLAGDSKAFSLIVNRHRSRVISVARKYARTEADAEDISQEVWLKASSSLDTYRREAQLSTWLHRIAANQGYDFRVHKSRREFSTLDEDKVTAVHPDLIVRPFADLDTRIVVSEALTTLPAAQRAAIILVDMVGMSVRDAAQRLEVAPGTVKSRRSRARESLKETLIDTSA